MPVIGFSLLGIGALFIYSGYLGYTPLTMAKAIIDGKLSTLTKIPIDPRKQTANPNNASNSGGSGTQQA